MRSAPDSVAFNPGDGLEHHREEHDRRREAAAGDEVADDRECDRAVAHDCERDERVRRPPFPRDEPDRGG